MNTAKELVETALRVLIAWNEGREPASADIETLGNASQFPAYLMPDEVEEALRSPAIDP